MTDQASALERAETAQLNLYRQAEHDRALRRNAEEAFDLIAPFVAKFAAAAPHYDGGTPRFPGSQFTLDPEPNYRAALTSTANPPCGTPPDGPTLGDLRMLADAYRAAMELRSALASPDAVEGREQLVRLREALTPSGDTKAAYMGEFSFHQTQVDEFGDEHQVRIYVPWTTVKEIMKSILERAEGSELPEPPAAAIRAQEG